MLKKKIYRLAALVLSTIGFTIFFSTWQISAQNSVEPWSDIVIPQNLFKANSQDFANSPDRQLNSTIKQLDNKLQPAKHPVVYVDLTENIQIKNKHLLAGDILLISSTNNKIKSTIEGYSLGSSPPPGKNVIISRGELLSRLKMKFPLYKFILSGANSVNILNVAATITKNNIIDFLRTFERARSKKNSSVEIEVFTPIENILLSPNELTYEIEYLNRYFSKSSPLRNWKISFLNNGLPAKQIIVKGQVKNIGNLASVKKSAPIKQIQDVSTPQNMALSQNKFTKTMIKEFSNLLSTNQSLQKEQNYIEIAKNDSPKNAKAESKEYFVLRGSPVTLVYRSKNLKIQTAAIALENGEIGDMIKIRNQNNRNTLFAKVIDQNIVLASNN